MKFINNTIIEFYKALSDLRGAPTIVDGANGKPAVEFEPYPLSEKAKWNAAKDREILKRTVVAHDEIMLDMKATLNAFKKTVTREAMREEDPKAREQKMAKARELIQDRVDELNEEMRNIGKREEEVSGLLLIPAKGLCLKTSKIPPTILSDLMPLIDGEPEFDEDAAKKK